MRKDYVNLKYEPDYGKEFICEYYVEPKKGLSLEDAATHIAGESSIDTWSEILTLNPRLAKKLKPSVFSINKKNKIIKIAYNPDLFELGSVSQFLSSVAGNIFSMNIIKNLRLIDISLPKVELKKFKGPLFGMEGVREKLKIKNRPLIGTIVKPKVGLSSEKHAKVMYEALFGGCDLVKDDENLTNQKFNPFERRVKLCLKLEEKAENETGERKAYIPNITAPTVFEMIKRAKFVKKLGGKYIMIDIIPTGWTALQTLREENENFKLIIHAHRCMHSAMTRNKRHGISMLIVAKLTRLIGLDQLHIGTAVGKMHGGRKEVLEIRDFCVKKWCGLKKLFPVASGGLQPLMIPDLYKIFGNNAIFQFGGGIHAHPLGTRQGAKAVRDALYATMEGVSLEEYAKGSRGLEVAIEKWSK